MLCIVSSHPFYYSQPPLYPGCKSNKIFQLFIRFVLFWTDIHKIQKSSPKLMLIRYTLDIWIFYIPLLDHS